MRQRLPDWFKIKLGNPGAVLGTRKLLGDLRLNTICQSALCPNLTECFSQGTATFLILGNTCTRNCTFCAVKKGLPKPIDESEPGNILKAVTILNLDYVVLTSVTRDDLADGGASHFASTIKLFHDKNIKVEVLIPDFQGSLSALRTVVEASPEVLNHNLETVPRLYPAVRPEADYSRSLTILCGVKRLNPTLATKSGLMLGLGETRDEIISVMRDLREAGCDLITLGQYLSPSSRHHPVARFIPPDEFESYRELALKMGFAGVASAPRVRSSFEAKELYAMARRET
ncbi:MAG: lipoyl synthase [Chloroflexota bacterium]